MEALLWVTVSGTLVWTKFDVAKLGDPDDVAVAHAYNVYRHNVDSCRSDQWKFARMGRVVFKSLCN